MTSVVEEVDFPTISLDELGKKRVKKCSKDYKNTVNNIFVHGRLTLVSIMIYIVIIIWLGYTFVTVIFDDLSCLDLMDSFLLGIYIPYYL